MADASEPTSRASGAEVDPTGQATTGPGGEEFDGADTELVLDEDLAREIADAGIVLDPIVYDRTSSAPPLDATVAREITDARADAEKAVRATHAKRPVQSKRPIVRLDPADVETLVHQRQHQAARDTAKELGVEPEVYYRRNPDAIANCTVHCRDEWPELGDAVYTKPGDERLYSLENYLAEGARTDDLADLVPTTEDHGYFDHLGESPELEEPPDLDELPPDLWYEQRMRITVEPLAADDPAAAQIKAAARSADEAVRAPDAVRAYTEKRDQELGPDAPWWDDTTHDRAHLAWHWAIRETCADLGVDPRVYFASEPDEVTKCDVDCAEAWPEITTVAVVEYPWDIDLTMRWDLEIDTPAEAQAAAAREVEAQGRDDQADWLRLNEHTLEEDPPATDLDSGLGCGF